MDKFGIEVNDPIFGAWFEAGPHLRTAREYNQRWARFLAPYWQTPGLMGTLRTRSNSPGSSPMNTTMTLSSEP